MFSFCITRLNKIPYMCPQQGGSRKLNKKKVGNFVPQAFSLNPPILLHPTFYEQRGVLDLGCIIDQCLFSFLIFTLLHMTGK